MGNRGRLEIIVDLLEICREEAIRTHLVYKANLNFKILRRYLKTLLDKNWVRDRGGDVSYNGEGEAFFKKSKGSSFGALKYL